MLVVTNYIIILWQTIATQILATKLLYLKWDVPFQRNNRIGGFHCNRVLLLRSTNCINPNGTCHQIVWLWRGRWPPNTVTVKRWFYCTVLKFDAKRNTHNADICTWFTPEWVRMSHDVVVYEWYYFRVSVNQRERTGRITVTRLGINIHLL